MDKLVLSFFVIWTVAWCGAHASIVRSKREISVQIGRSVYIHPDDLVLDGGTTCKVELDVFDPVSQRVGTLEPKVSALPTCRVLMQVFAKTFLYQWS
jgi:hypothetical protein